ncbi:MAG: V-type ATP synthase subunit A [Bacteroidetes bacterium]|nr:MAG: V-type ATP synthase subunit A [Bacteroidota bacterium]
MTQGTIRGIIANLIIAEAKGHVAQNEICYIVAGEEQLMAEVIKIQGKNIFIQCFESTRGLRVGMPVNFTGRMLEVEVGPGMLSRIYDGLQNDLETMDSLFLQRGQYTPALDDNSRWDFRPLATVGQSVRAGDWLGEVTENGMAIKIMAPFDLEGEYQLKSLAEAGTYGIRDTVATLANGKDHQLEVNMVQRWPVKVALKAYSEKIRPYKMLETGVRTIDCLNPIVEGGTGFIPGPFGSGKTVLQHAISKQAEADIIIFAACGERANEVVEIFYEFPELEDPRTGGKLMDRTIIIANTSNMPVAAREASVYTAMTLAEYYRTMGLRVLLLADSTSRWAQALREMSNRLEELPGPDAFPMDLTAVIANFYARAGYVYLNNGETGSITFLGTVSPAGGNLKEPVTEATKKSARCFYSLSQRRADQKRYPSIDPVSSYSKYLEYPEMQEYLAEKISPTWVEQVIQAKDILLRGKELNDQISILGDDGVPIEYHDIYWKSEVIDFIILQQDAFDKIDALTKLDRLEYMLKRVLDIYRMRFEYQNFEEVGTFFKRVINLLRQMNYAEFQSEQFQAYEKELESMLNERRIA